MEPLTYRDAGVDIEAGDAAVRRIAPLARSTSRPEVMGGIGAFAGFFRMPSGFTDPVLVSSTDGVGTKLKVAFLADRHDTVGIDLVAMGVNDVLVHGAEPVFFLDYLATAKVDPPRIEAIVSGIAEGCRQAGCALIGGETAELPDFYAPGEYDLAGFVVGVVERNRIVDGSRAVPGDVVVGLDASGLHSNGYSLARRIVFDVLGLSIDSLLPGTGVTVGEELLRPTQIYVPGILPLLRGPEAHDVRAMAHITGGGLTGNLPRVLPEGCRAIVRRGAWTPPAVFGILQEAGRVADAEMFRTFNMGIGYAMVVPAPEAGRIMERVSARLAGADRGIGARVIGEIVAGERGVEILA